MTQPLSIENKEHVSFITTRTAGSKLWFINDKYLELLVLGVLGRYQEMYGAVIYAFILMGNHYHLIANFPRGNRAKFMRDFNSSVGRLVGRIVKVHGRRSVWARRYSHQVLPNHDDVKHWFYYSALNPVYSGLVARMHEYECYNSFHDAAAGVSRTVKWIDWSAYQLKSRYNKDVKPSDFEKEYKLTYTRLPGTENMSSKEYEEMLLGELKTRQDTAVEARRSAGKGFLGIDGLRSQVVGSEPKNTKTSSRYSFRPLVLTLCLVTKKRFLEAYFAIFDQFVEASRAFRNGDRLALFPRGTYPPLLPVTI